jgi:hypothetical protein
MHNLTSPLNQSESPTARSTCEKRSKRRSKRIEQLRKLLRNGTLARMEVTRDRRGAKWGGKPCVHYGFLILRRDQTCEAIEILNSFDADQNLVIECTNPLNSIVGKFDSDSDREINKYAVEGYEFIGYASMLYLSFWSGTRSKLAHEDMITALNND